MRLRKVTWWLLLAVLAGHCALGRGHYCYYCAAPIPTVGQYQALDSSILHQRIFAYPWAAAQLNCAFSTLRQSGKAQICEQPLCVTITIRGVANGIQSNFTVLGCAETILRPSMIPRIPLESRVRQNSGSLCVDFDHSANSTLKYRACFCNSDWCNIEKDVMWLSQNAAPTAISEALPSTSKAPLNQPLIALDPLGTVLESGLKGSLYHPPVIQADAAPASTICPNITAAPHGASVTDCVSAIQRTLATHELTKTTKSGPSSIAHTLTVPTATIRNSSFSGLRPTKIANSHPIGRNRQRTSTSLGNAANITGDPSLQRIPNRGPTSHVVTSQALPMTPRPLPAWNMAAIPLLYVTTHSQGKKAELRLSKTAPRRDPNRMVIKPSYVHVEPLPVASGYSQRMSRPFIGRPYATAATTRNPLFVQASFTPKPIFAKAILAKEPSPISRSKPRKEWTESPDTKSMAVTSVISSSTYPSISSRLMPIFRVTSLFTTPKPRPSPVFRNISENTAAYRNNSADSTPQAPFGIFAMSNTTDHLTNITLNQNDTAQLVLASKSVLIEPTSTIPDKNLTLAKRGDRLAISRDALSLEHEELMRLCIHYRASVNSGTDAMACINMALYLMIVILSCE